MSRHSFKLPGWLSILLLAVAVTVSSNQALLADILRWDNGELIPGTEGITPGPGVQLQDRFLDFADLKNKTLTDATFARSDLTSATFQEASLTRAIFTDAEIRSANLSDTTARGFTKEQL